MCGCDDVFILFIFFLPYKDKCHMACDVTNDRVVPWILTQFKSLLKFTHRPSLYLNWPALF